LDHQTPRRPIRSYVLRQGRMSNAQKRAYEQLLDRYALAYSPHALDFTVAFTWAKDEDRTTAFNDAFNRVNQKRLASGAQPFVLTTGFSYEVQKWSQNKMMNLLGSGWTLQGGIRYSSGVLLVIPTSVNLLNSQIFQNTDAPTSCSSRSRSPAATGSVGKRTWVHA
jgi:hypothetical protein